MSQRILIFMITICSSTLIAYAQFGDISGRVVDTKTGDPLMGANVILVENSQGSATDLDGFYTIRNIPAGRYSLMVTYIGYQQKKINDVEVRGGQLSRIDISVEPTSLEMASVIVEVQANRVSDSYMLTQQRNSVNTQDGIAASQISRSGDSNAAEAAKRISGVTIIDDKFVYVRGLGDRYTTTEMNSAPIPSPEPEKKTVPLNLFPSSILESVTAYKTYTPDMPGAFAGGNINIKTKAYPDNRILSVSVSGSAKTYPRRNQAYMVPTSNSGSGFWGFDKRRYAMPSSIPDGVNLNVYNIPGYNTHLERAELLGQVGRDFKTDYTTRNGQASKPISLGLSLGNRYTITDYLEWGYFANTSFSNDYSYKVSNDILFGSDNSGLFRDIDVTNRKSGYNTNIAATFSTGFKFLNSQKVALHYVFTHNSESYVNLGRGMADQFDDGIFYKEFYAERSISNLTLSGNHQFNFYAKHKFDWSYNRGRSELYQPDFKGNNYRVKNQIMDGDTVEYYQMDTYGWSAGTRDFTEGDDNNENIDLNYMLTAQDRFESEYKLKVGSRFQNKNRDFTRRVFYNKYAYQWFVGEIPSDLTVYYDIDELGSALVDSNYFSVNEDGSVNPGLIIAENTQPNDGYRAVENLDAFYFMVDMPLGLGLYSPLNIVRFIAGVRREDYTQNMTPYSPANGEKYYSNILGDTVDIAYHKVDYLPSYNLFVQLPNNFNIRLSHSRTVARAEFRELAPFEFQALYGGEIVVGYPWLKTTNIHNYDLRAEWFHSVGEVLAVSLFKKDFYNPIERAIFDLSDKRYRTYQNTDKAQSWGIEFDSRTSLDFIPTNYGKSSLLFNFTWTQSEVTPDDSITIFTGQAIPNQGNLTKRPLQGQSDFIVNISIMYTDLKGFNAALSYNAFSKRLVSLGISPLPDEYELPFHLLNFTASKTFNKLKLSFKMKNILNSRVVFAQADPASGKYLETTEYHPGRSFSIGLSYDIF